MSIMEFSIEIQADHGSRCGGEIALTGQGDQCGFFALQVRQGSNGTSLANFKDPIIMDLVGIDEIQFRSHPINFVKGIDVDFCVAICVNVL